MSRGYFRHAPVAVASHFVLDNTVALYYISATVFRKPNPASGIPIYLQIEEQIRHAIETGALAAGTQLPSIRSLAETLVINPHTVARVYRDLESEGAIEIRHGLGAFVAEAWRERVRTDRMRSAQKLVRTVVRQLKALGLEEDEIRRLVEAETAEHELVAGRR
jgi:DNA-binding transcriptional regulator YhcF (GntR family)